MRSVERKSCVQQDEDRGGKEALQVVVPKQEVGDREDEGCMENTKEVSGADTSVKNDIGLVQESEAVCGSSMGLEHMDIVNFPTDKLLEMLTSLLYKIVKSNDQSKSFQEGNHDINNQYVAHVLSFRGKHVPAITLGDYFARIQKYCPITNDVFLSLLVYFDRIAKRCNAVDPQLFVMDSHNIHRLIIAAVTVSTKFFSDFFYSNSRYARVGGISLPELNRLELQFSILCDFELIVSVQELQRYADLLYMFWKREQNNRLAVSDGATPPTTVITAKQEQSAPLSTLSSNSTTSSSSRSPCTLSSSSSSRAHLSPSTG